MENKDRMFTGDLYLPNDAAITEEQNACLELLYTFNQTLLNRKSEISF